MSLEAPPPSRHISSKPISLADASQMLETYLTNSEAHPHLHPDALITPAGVTFSSAGGPMGGVVMHNLRRIAAGLRGEYLEPEATPEPEENGEEIGTGKKAKQNKKKTFDSNGAVEEDWQDMAEYEQEGPGLEVGEVGPRTNFVQEGGEEPEVEAAETPKKRKNAEGGEKLDKDARKKAKAERRKQEQKDKEKKRQKTA